MMYQVQWQFKDNRPAEFVRQFELTDEMGNDDKHWIVSKIMDEVNKSHPLPKDAQWMILNEKSKHFVMTTEVE